MASEDEQAHRADATCPHARGQSAPICGSWSGTLPTPRSSRPGGQPPASLLVAFASTALRSTAHTMALFLRSPAAVAAALLVASRRPCRGVGCPFTALLVLPLACDGLVALLRHPRAAAQSGYSSLLVLPVVWVAFVGGRRSVLFVVAAMAATIMLPIALVGAPDYPSTGWRGAVLLTLVAAIVGLVTEHGVKRDAAARRGRDAPCTHARPPRADPHRDRDERLRLSTTSSRRSSRKRSPSRAPTPRSSSFPTATTWCTARSPARPCRSAGLRLAAAGSASGHCLATVEPLVVHDTETDDAGRP